MEELTTMEQKLRADDAQFAVGKQTDHPCGLLQNRMGIMGLEVRRNTGTRY
jgi:hypothetical protein